MIKRYNIILDFSLFLFLILIFLYEDKGLYFRLFSVSWKYIFHAWAFWIYDSRGLMKWILKIVGFSNLSRALVLTLVRQHFAGCPSMWNRSHASACTKFS